MYNWNGLYRLFELNGKESIVLLPPLSVAKMIRTRVYNLYIVDNLQSWQDENPSSINGSPINVLQSPAGDRKLPVVSKIFRFRVLSLHALNSNGIQFYLLVSNKASFTYLERRRSMV